MDLTLTEWMSSFKNIFIGGDFNIHIDDKKTPEAQIFNDTTEALGGQQHVDFPTHCAGNTPAQSFTEITSQLNTRISKGRYISDHRAIIAELNVGIKHAINTIVTFRNLRQINAYEFIASLNFGNVENWENPSIASEIYEKELTRVLN